MGINIIRPPVDTTNLAKLNEENSFGEFAQTFNETLVALGEFGVSSTLNPALSGAGTRMIWYPRKAAFRAGSINGTQWDDANVGSYSVAFGQNNKASGLNSFIGGGIDNTITVASGASRGYDAIGGGYQNTINITSGNWSANYIGAGENNTIGTQADGVFIGGGYNNTAGGWENTLVGGESNTIGIGKSYNYIGGGYGNTISNDYAIIVGGESNTVDALKGVILGGYGNWLDTNSTLSLVFGQNIKVENGENTTVFGYKNSTPQLTVSQSNAFIIHGDTGYEKKVGIQTIAPSATLDVNGTVNITSTTVVSGDVTCTANLTVNGNVNGLSTNYTAGSSGTFATAYQPSLTDITCVTVSVRCTTTASSGYAYIEVKSDASATPSAIIATSGIESEPITDLAGTFTATFMVKPGDYYQIDKYESNGTVTIKQWIVNTLSVS